ncbi:FKBP-type peptidyl-prolyl cis-trans isomerase [Pokkaliibacter sp. CJK22405]|uniref:FKBP-type peptidyl-prolyl cis-trans isomerase n=1 Tax=Pokkaliibacter sp. CJK22405 TaxID=3384615 RepID=UPI0039848267
MTNSAAEVALHARVTLHFSLTLQTGELVDSNFDREPASFVVGDGSLLEGFERALLGRPEGAEVEVILEPEHAFGQWNPANIQYFKPDQFDQEMILEEGMVISFSDAINSELPGVVSAIEPDRVTVDFNHPLAGKAIIFKAKLYQVQPPV